MSNLRNLLKLQDEEEQKLLKYDQARLKILKKYRKAEASGNSTNIAILKGNLDVNKSKINDAQGFYDLAVKNLQSRLKEVDSKINELPNLIENRKPLLNSKQKDQVKETWEKQLSEAKKEIDEYKKAILAKAPEKEQLYQKEKAKFFDIVNSILKDPKSLNSIVDPLSSYQEKKTGIGVKNIAQTGSKAIGFFLNNEKVNFSDILRLKSFYPEEIDKFREFLSDKKKFSNNNLPFFVRLIQDKDFKDFLVSNSTNLNNIIEIITPTLSAVALKQLGRIDALEKKLKSKKLKNLPVLEKELEQLQQQPISTANSNRIDALTKKIRPLRSLPNDLQIARFITNLENIGITEEYINQKLMPVILDLPSKILKDPQDFADFTTVAISYVLAQNEIQKKEALGQTLDKIDLNKLLENLKLVNFLKTEVPTLTRVATNVIESTLTLKNRLANYNISNNLIANAIPLATHISSTILQDVQGIAKLYENLKPVILDDTTINIKQTTNEKEVESLKQERAKKLKDASNGLAQVLLKEDILKIVLKETPAFLKENKEALTNVAATAIPNALGKLSTNIAPEVYKSVVPLAIDLTGNILKDLDGTKINDIYKNVSDIVSKKERPEALASLLTIGSELLASPGTSKILSEDLPNLLLKEDTQKAIEQLAENFITSNKEIKDRLDNLQVSDNLIKNTIPLITGISSTALQKISISKVIESLAPIISDDTIIKTKQTTDEIEVELLKQKRAEKVSKMLDTMPDLVLKNNFLEMAIKKIPDFFEKNKVELSQIAAAAIPNALGKLSTNIAPEVYKSVVPLAIDLTGNILKDLDGTKINDIYKNISDIVSKEERPEALASLLTIGSELLASPGTSKILSEDLPNLLLKEDTQKAIEQLAENFITSNKEIKDRLDNLQVSDNLIKNTIPLITGISSTALQKISISKVIESLAPIISDDTIIKIKQTTDEKEVELLKQKRAEKVSKMLDTMPDLVLKNNFLEMAIKKIPDFFEKNKVELSQIAAAAIPNALGKLSTNIAPEVYKSVVPLAIDLTGNILKDLDGTKINDIYKNISDIVSKEERPEALASLLTIGSELLASPGTSKILSQDLPNLLQNKNIELALNQVVENLIETNLTIKNQLSTYNISDSLIKNAIPLTTSIASGGLNEFPKLIDVYAEFKYVQELDLSADSRTNLEEKEVLKLKKQKIITNMLTKTQQVLANNNLQTFLKTNLPAYLSENKESVVKVVEEIITKNNQVKNLLSTNSTSPALVKEVTEVGLDFIADAIPLFNELGQEVLSNPAELSKIITNAQEITKIPEKERKQEILKLVSSIIDFKNNNSALNDIIEQKLPTLLIKHADKLGSVADKFLNETKIGKKLNVKGEEIIKLASNHLPELTEIADLYSKRKYAAIIPKATKLLFKKDVLELISKAVVGLIKPDNKTKTTPSNTAITILDNNLEKSIIFIEEIKKLGKKISNHVQSGATEQAPNKESLWLKKIMNKRQMEMNKPTNKVSRG